MAKLVAQILMLIALLLTIVSGTGAIGLCHCHGNIFIGDCTCETQHSGCSCHSHHTGERGINDATQDKCQHQCEHESIVIDILCSTTLRAEQISQPQFCFIIPDYIDIIPQIKERRPKYSFHLPPEHQRHRQSYAIGFQAPLLI